MSARTPYDVYSQPWLSYWRQRTIDWFATVPCGTDPRSLSSLAQLGPWRDAQFDEGPVTEDELRALGYTGTLAEMGAAAHESFNRALANGYDVGLQAWAQRCQPQNVGGSASQTAQNIGAYSPAQSISTVQVGGTGAGAGEFGQTVIDPRNGTVGVIYFKSATNLADRIVNSGQIMAGWMAGAEPTNPFNVSDFPVGQPTSLAGQGITFPIGGKAIAPSESVAASGVAVTTAPLNTKAELAAAVLLPAGSSPELAPTSSSPASAPAATPQSQSAGGSRETAGALAGTVSILGLQLDKRALVVTVLLALGVVFLIRHRPG
jgi:hypothetical protein